MTHQLGWFYNPITDLTLVFSEIPRMANLHGLQPVAHSEPLLLDLGDSGEKNKRRQAKNERRAEKVGKGWSVSVV